MILARLKLRQKLMLLLVTVGLVGICSFALIIALAGWTRIREVFRNLVENGIKFTPTDRVPHVRIDAVPQSENLLCRVSDNGAGIEPRYRSKVFGLFDRLDSNVPGTGVGLALVKRIVEIHEGDIWIESPGNGQGSIFCFTLPMHRGS